MSAAIKVLLHVCCGPCAIMPLFRLQEAGFEPVAWFFNPNVQPLMEYLRRREGALQIAEKLAVPIIFEDEYDLQGWLGRQLPLAASKERCVSCCADRLEKAGMRAKELGCRFFSTSLLYSRYQPHGSIRLAGEKTGAKNCVKFLYMDFRTDWQAGIDLSRAWGVYRQPYCGCIFSESERYASKLERLAKKQKTAGSPM